jgi:hypothetical protein
VGGVTGGVRARGVVRLPELGLVASDVHDDGGARVLAAVEERLEVVEESRRPLIDRKGP